jgi:putative hydrolase of the HAD superfamily
VALRGLLLDAMGTLIGLRRSVGAVYSELAASHGLAVDAGALDRVFPAVYRQAPPLACPGLAGAELLAAERTWWGERIAEAFAACGQAGPLPPQLAGALFDRFAEPDLWHVYPDVAGPLEAWQRRGLKLAVVSNFDQRLSGLLEGLGLADAFAAVVVSSAAGAAKPDPRPFRLALEALGLAPEAVWHVGDSPEDEAGARAAGVRPVLIRRLRGADPTPPGAGAR